MSLVVSFEEIFAKKTGLLSNHSSWKRVELGDICAVVNGFPFKSALFNREKGFPIVRIRDLGRDSAGTFYNGDVPKEVIVNGGDLLVGMDGIFRCCEWRGRKAGLNQRVCKLVPNEDYLDRKFLLFGINGYLKAIEDATSSVTVGHLSSRDILRIPFPLPPLEEQRRIIAKLKKLLDKVEVCQKRLVKIPVLLKRFRQSVLAAACSGRLTADWRERNPVAPMNAVSKSDNEDLPTGWKSVCVGDAIEDLRYGTARKCSYEKHGVPVLRIPNVVNGTIDHTDLKYAELPSKEFGQLRLRPGDILLIRSNGSVSLVGKCALVREQERDFAYAGYLIRIRPKQGIVEPKFLNLVLGSYDIRLQIELEARSTSGVNNINGDEVRALRFLLPPRAERKEIVCRAEALFTLADQIEARYTKAKVYVDKLTQSLLSKAFRGELVPQDPSDEPAGKLLEDIHTLKGKSKPKTMKKNKKANAYA